MAGRFCRDGERSVSIRARQTIDRDEHARNGKSTYAAATEVFRSDFNAAEGGFIQIV